MADQACVEQTPDEVVIADVPREPVSDPTLGIPVDIDRRGTPRHRLVCIGDSLTHGFQSGAVFRTELSYPAIIAHELGWFDHFRRPGYRGFGGLPLNVELLIRDLERDFGDRLSWWELPSALFRVRHLMDEIEDWWERQATDPPNFSGINHNLAVYGWDLFDARTRTAASCQQDIKVPTDQFFKQIVQNANERAALRVLGPGPADQEKRTLLLSARALGDEGTFEGGGQNGDGAGIETLIVLLGANNALASVTGLKVCWSQDEGFQDPQAKRAYTVWRPSHFQAELDAVAAEVHRIKARHVIWATVPHVTIAPIARGVGSSKRQPGSRYFEHYTRPWIDSRSFDPGHDPQITADQARAIDSAIDAYNEAIEAKVHNARQEGRDWRLLDIAGLLDRLASRRYIEDPDARPPWWTPYKLPDDLAALSPPPDSRFFGAGPGGRSQGGLFSLDGVHPTTIGYGIMAQEFIHVMAGAGVKFYSGEGHEREGPIRVDFRRLIEKDTLISDPPRSLSADLRLLGWLDEASDFAKRMLEAGA